MDRKAHWERLYTTRAPTDVSWYQAHPALSLELIAATGVGAQGRIIDVGGGASLLVDRLLDAGYARLTVLDLSATALRRAQARLGSKAGALTWLEGDVTTIALPAAAFDVWHDRAAFHFLTDEENRERYLAQVRRALAPQGHLILATFAMDGPTRCSGLDVVRYDAEALQRALGPAFALVDTRREAHVTPGQVRQQFIYTHFRKVE